MSQVVASFSIVRYPPGKVLHAITAMGRDWLPLRRTRGLRFLRQMGSARTALASSGADWRQWALFAVWDDEMSLEAFLHGASVARAWAEHASEACTLELAPLRSKGRWGGRDPLAGAVEGPQDWGGRVAALTRATLNPRTMRSFHAAGPEAYRAFLESPGVLAAAWVSEFPLLRFGTFSVWESQEAVEGFAYARPAHVEVMRRTRQEGWYAEELFARFAVTRSWGTWGGRRITEGAEQVII